MAKALEIVDETARGEVTARMTLVLASDCVTARTIIERRVRVEVDTFNYKGDVIFRGLIQPAETERVEQGYRLTQHRWLDADAQVARAWEAFDRNQFFMLVGDRQIESLDEEVVVLPDMTVSFVRLVPLVGG